MNDKVFIDTNIFIYALTKSKNQEEQFKRNISLELLQNLLTNKQIIISLQVINEFHFNELEITKLVDENILKICTVMPIGFETYKVSSNLRLDYKFSYWDSLIVSSAIESKCSTLYSEDMQHNQIINDQLKIIDPFHMASFDSASVSSKC